MAAVQARRRKDGGTSYRVQWRLGGSRDGHWQSETFTNLSKAERFSAMVESNGELWPEGWVKGRGFVPATQEDSTVTFANALLRYIDQLTGIQPDTRDRYRSMVRTLVAWECCDPRSTSQTYRPFARLLIEMSDEDIRHWINQWPRAPKTKRNYLQALLAPAMEWAVKKNLIGTSPSEGISIGRSTGQSEVRHLSEQQFWTLHALAHEDIRDLLEVAVGTGLRWGEITALWCQDVDVEHSILKVTRAWKKQGQGWDTDPVYVAAQSKGTIQAKHSMRGHFLGGPKSRKSYRSVTLSPAVVAVLERNMRGKAGDDFIFTSPTGLPLHNGDFYEDRWAPLLTRTAEAGLTVRPRFHDLRHTHAVWLITARVPLTVIQQRLGHESITTTNDTYGGFLVQASDAADAAIDAALRGVNIRAGS